MADPSNSSSSPRNLAEQNQEPLGPVGDLDDGIDWSDMDAESRDSDQDPDTETDDISTALVMSLDHDLTSTDGDDEVGLENDEDGVVWLSDEPLADGGESGIGVEDAAGIADWESVERSEDDADGPERWGDAGIDLSREEGVPFGEEEEEQQWRERDEGDVWKTLADGGTEADVTEAEIPWESVPLPLDSVGDMVDVSVSAESVLVVGVAGVVELRGQTSFQARWLQTGRHRAGRWESAVTFGDEQQCVILATGRALWRVDNDWNKIREARGVSAGRGGYRTILAGKGRENMVLATTSEGALWASADGGHRWVNVEGTGRVCGATWDEQRGAVILSKRDGAWILLRSADGTTWRSEPLPDEVMAGMAGGDKQVNVTDDRICLVDRDGLVIERLASGEWSPRCVVGGAMVSVTGAVVDDGSLLIVGRYDVSEDRTSLISVSPDGRARVIAQVSATDEGVDADGSSVELSRVRWDPYRRLLWAVGEFGVRAWKMPCPA